MKDKDFWQGLKVNYDKIATKGGDPLKLLFESFFRGKAHVATRIIGDPEKFISNLHQYSEEQLKDLLSLIHVNYLWDTKPSGPRYNVEPERLSITVNSLVQDLRSSKSYVIQDIGDFFIMWSFKEKLVYEKDPAHEIISVYKRYPGQPSIIHVENTYFEIRGSLSTTKKIQKMLQDRGLSETRAELNNEKLAKNLKLLFEQENAICDLISVGFRESRLPSHSTIRVQNQRGILHDIKELANLDIIDPGFITDIDYVTLRLKNLGKDITVNIEQTLHGFKFVLDDKRLDIPERDQIRHTLSDLLGIVFDYPYPYESQDYGQRINFHRILSGNYVAYQTHRNAFDNKLNAVIKVVKFKEKEMRYCQSCGKLFSQLNECPKCKSTMYSKETIRKMDFNEQELSRIISSRIKAIDEKLFTKEDSKLVKFKIQTKEVKKKHIPVADLIRFQQSGDQGLSRAHLFYFYPMRKGRIPAIIDEYLYDTVLVIHGDSYFKKDSYEHFGCIDLYDLLMNNDQRNAHIIMNAIEQSIRLTDYRIRVFVKESYERLAKLVNNETLASDYKGKDFEKDVYYLLRWILPFTERWGRIGKSESDGLLIIPQRNDNYFIASYDPKLSIDFDAYNLDSAEENKAAYYILDETINERINMLSDDSGVSAHIVISNIFNEKRLPAFANGVRNWYRKMEKIGAKSIDVPILFLKLDALLMLFEIYQDNWEFVKANNKFSKEFFAYITEKTLSAKDYKVINKNEIETFRTHCLALRNSIKYKGPVSKTGERSKSI